MNVCSFQLYTRCQEGDEQPRRRLNLNCLQTLRTFLDSERNLLACSQIAIAFTLNRRVEHPCYRSRAFTSQYTDRLVSPP